MFLNQRNASRYQYLGALLPVLDLFFLKLYIALKASGIRYLLSNFVNNEAVIQMRFDRKYQSSFFVKIKKL